LLFFVFVLFFLTTRRQHPETFKRKGKTCQCLEQCPFGVKKEIAAVVAPHGHPPKIPHPQLKTKQNTPQVHRNLSGDGIGGFVTGA
jgi:hypothetical protein